MIPRLEGWTWQPRRDGVTLSVARPELRATIHSVEGLRSLDQLGRLLREERLPLGAIGTQRVCRALESIVTNEGEYATVGRFEGDTTTWVLGFVFADTGYTYLEGSALPEHGDALETVVHDLVRAERVQLGIRRRRYLFRPPRWRRVTLGGLTAHFVQDPADASPRISVYPAIPCTAGEMPALDLQRVLGEDLLTSSPGPSSDFAIIARADPAAIEVASGLTGTRWRFAGRWGDQPVARDIVVLRDEGHAYTAELVTPPDRVATARSVFDAVVDSIQPVPRALTRPRIDHAFTHRAD